MTAAVISHVENLEALQVLCQKLRGSDPLDLLFAARGSADAVATVPAHVRVDGTNDLRLTAITSPGVGTCCSEPPGGRHMTAAVAFPTTTWEALQGLGQELGSPGPADLLFADSTNVPIAAPTQRPPLPHQESASHQLLRRGHPSRGDDMTAGVVSYEEMLESLQGLWHEGCGPDPADLLFAGPDATDVMVAAPACARLHGITTLPRTTFPDEGTRSPESPEATT
ncbi:hypothetical protein ABZX92_10930 [Lentzea sp. NPDC006480]|uniref:hypothetical protein n=1 Tax=Lentzea sp. NPDC006480 TaxID=3157176 RepID=UPI0033A24497